MTSKLLAGVTAALVICCASAHARNASQEKQLNQYCARYGVGGCSHNDDEVCGSSEYAMVNEKCYARSAIVICWDHGFRGKSLDACIASSEDARAKKNGFK